MAENTKIDFVNRIAEAVASKAGANLTQVHQGALERIQFEKPIK